MKKLIFLSAVIMFLSLTLASAHTSHLVQSATTAERWYDEHVLGFDPNPSDKLTIYYDVPFKYHNPKVVRFYKPRYVMPTHHPILRPSHKTFFKIRMY